MIKSRKKINYCQRNYLIFITHSYELHVIINIFYIIK